MGWFEILARFSFNLVSHAYLACCADWFYGRGPGSFVRSDDLVPHADCVAVLTVGERL